METEAILYRKERGVATITLNRPEVRNALSYDTVRQISDAIEEAGRDEEVRAIVITGAGRIFSAGGERKELAQFWELPPEERDRTINTTFRRMVKVLRRLPKPVIAAVNGDAVGGGMDLALACDIRIASETARFSEMFVRLGAAPGVSGMYFLPRLVGLGKAAELAFTGDFIDAREAERIGLINKAVPPEELGDEVRDLAERLANGPTKVIGLIKQGLNQSFAQDLDEALVYFTDLTREVVQTEDHREGMRAAIEKRRPVFTGR
ncbi:MAG: enoyl-CoA hydratase [Chloroflexi bacterium]|nr:enoyl-CoA hydratase [Chloroflexota bacterium]